MVLQLSKNKRIDCPKCGQSMDYRAKQCKSCRKREQQSTKGQTLANKFTLCGCGSMKDKRAKRCGRCRSEHENELKIQRLTCPKCGGKMGRKSSLCFNCYGDTLRSEIIDGKKSCLSCDMIKPLDQFGLRGENRYLSQCKDCVSLGERNRHIRRKCGSLNMSLKDTWELMRKPGINCEICGCWTEKFHIDHCHTTNSFRGLLCPNCNSGMGLLGDNPDRLRAAAEYLISKSR